jgi:pyruvate dehydrogenase E2 component (dihydrolipoamide acetyltransferase)
MDILMPQLGETVAEGKITTWFKAVGDTVAPGDNLFEIETDKVSMEVPAIAGGVLAEIRVPAGTAAPVGAVVAILSGGPLVAEAAAQAAPPTTAAATGAGTRAPAAGTAAAPAPAPVSTPVSAPTVAAAHTAMASAATPVRTGPLDPFHAVRSPEKNFGPARLAGGRTITPLARRLAAEAGIDVSAIVATGPHGRIFARDIEVAITSGAGGSAATPPLATGPTAERIKALYEAGSYEELPADAMRRTIAARLVEAKQTVPHFYLSCDVTLDKLLALRHEANAAAPHGSDGMPVWKLSVNDLILRALARALVAVPAANAVWAGDRILRFHRIDIGIAVALDGGLITPVLRDAAAKSMRALATEAKDLVARARDRTLKPGEYQGGVSTVSNLGMYGVREFAGIVNPPQSTLLAVGAAERRPVEADDGSLRFETRMTITLSCDHRVVDGALGATLLAAIKHGLEKPVGLLV